MSIDEESRPYIGFIVSLIGSIYAIISLAIFSLVTLGALVIGLLFSANINLIFIWASIFLPFILYIGTFISAIIALFKIKPAKILNLVFGLVSLVLIIYALIAIGANPSIFGQVLLSFSIHPLIASIVVVGGGILLMYSI
ncbi:MAG: hypothetical protein ACTSX4_07360 [Candidatus Helarchaeota archaeon]